MSQDYSDRPNLVRVARAIAAGKRPERTLKALEAVLTAQREEGKDNNECFNALLNACGEPRRVYNALWAFAGAGEVQELRKECAE